MASRELTPQEEALFELQKAALFERRSSTSLKDGLPNYLNNGTVNTFLELIHCYAVNSLSRLIHCCAVNFLSRFIDCYAVNSLSRLIIAML
jgi:hypothetical protein